MAIIAGKIFNQSDVVAKSKTQKRGPTCSLLVTPREPTKALALESVLLQESRSTAIQNESH
jgi:hypothetical protein